MNQYSQNGQDESSTVLLFMVLSAFFKPTYDIASSKT